MTEPNASNQEVLPPDRRPPRRFGSVVLGLVVIVLGIVFLLDNLGFVRSGQILRFWPLIVIAVGVRGLWGARDRGAVVTAGLLAAAGGLLLLDSLHMIDFSVWRLWPLVLVAVGFRLLLHSRSDPDGPAAADSAEIASAFLCGVERRIRSTDFRSGSASAFMGGVNLDFTGADMAEDRAVLHVFVTMGGVEIRIPEEWTADVRVAPLMGGVEDKTRGSAAAVKRLVVEGTVFMGGVEIRN